MRDFFHQKRKIYILTQQATVRPQEKKENSPSLSKILIINEQSGKESKNKIRIRRQRAALVTKNLIKITAFKS